MMLGVAASFMRLLGFLGLVPLGLVNICGSVRAVHDGDSKGMALMLFMTALLMFFAVTLWRGAKHERGSAQGRLADGWDGAPVTAFFAGVVARTLEGRIYIAGAVASGVAAVLALFHLSHHRSGNRTRSGSRRTRRT